MGEEGSARHLPAGPPAPAPAPASFGLECGENLSTFDASPEKAADSKAQATQDAAALLVLLSQSAEPEPEAASSGLECEENRSAWRRAALQS